MPLASKDSEEQTKSTKQMKSTKDNTTSKEDDSKDLDKEKPWIVYLRTLRIPII